jgi:hypothetical protein
MQLARFSQASQGGGHAFLRWLRVEWHGRGRWGHVNDERLVQLRCVRPCSPGRSAWRHLRLRFWWCRLRLGRAPRLHPPADAAHDNGHAPQKAKKQKQKNDKTATFHVDSF